MDYINDAKWLFGLDSLSDPGGLGQGFYQWSQNVTNRGGMIGTRQGFAEITSVLNKVPRGICLFAPHAQGVNPFLVVAIDNKIYYLAPPYTGNLIELPNVNFPTQSTKRMVHFEVCVQAQTHQPDDTVIQINPRLVLIMQDGITRPAYWYYDGQTSVSGHANPAATHKSTPPWNTKIGNYMKWAGDRLWVAAGNRLWASDLLNPLQFEESEVTVSGGFFYLPGVVTGMGVTQDYKSLLVFTEQTTSAFQVGIEDRTLWPNTQDFQRVIFPSIGCSAHRTIINQYGLTWWASHDGIVALDNAFAAYQTSSMKVKDQNMSRSKEGVNWSIGGGCAGTYNNWLFFSMPSGSKYNVHTWVMDQSVLETMGQNIPPAWCSNWTGIRPEQWVTGVVNGDQRCFCIANDPVPEGRQSTIWEAFIGQRMDVPKVTEGGNEVRKAKDIGCAFETKFLSLSPNQYMKFRYAELDIAEIIGKVNLQVYYCGRRTSYKKILEKKLYADVSGVTEVIFDPDTLINVFVPQYRTVRTVTDVHDKEDANTGIQTPLLRSIDKEFSLLVTWTGQMTLTGLRLCVDQQSDTLEGICERDETTIRRITAEGTGAILTTPAPDNTFINAFTSKYIAPLRPRWVEFPAYDSATANGVFFVVQPVVDPAGGAYPANQYPKTVTMNTETVGSQIIYTTDGQIPKQNPLVGHVYPPSPSITMGQVLKVKAFRSGLTPSSMVTAPFTHAQAGTPVFIPAPGAYPADSYPMNVNIYSAPVFTGERIRYTTDTTNPTRTHGTAHDGASVVVSLPANRWLKARVYDTTFTGGVPNYADSDQFGGAYTVSPKCAKPTANPHGGQYAYPKNVVLATATVGANIRYTINNTNIAAGTVIPPNGNHTIVVHSGDVVRAIAQKATFIDSDIMTETYSSATQKVAEPYSYPDGADITGTNIAVSLHCFTPNVTIVYTYGSQANPPPDPTHATTPHHTEGDVVILGNIGHTMIKMLAFRADMTDSVIHKAYFDHVSGGSNNR